MRVFMTGGTGFVGSGLARRLSEDGHEVTVLARPSDRLPKLPDGASYLLGDPNEPGEWQAGIVGHDAIVNLAGASIFKRWTEANKRAIRESRLRTTKNLVDAIGASGREGITLLSTSAVGWYGSRGDEVLDESSARGEGFLADLAVDWETEASRATSFGARVVRMRFGVVLGAGGGALDKLVSIFKWWVGSPLGDGKQWFSWIHLRDLLEATVFALQGDGLEGPLNFTAPSPVRNEEMTEILGEAMKKPVFMPKVPRFALSTAMGELSSLFLDSQRAVPSRLLDAGFEFEFPDLRGALDDLVGG